MKNKHVFLLSVLALLLCMISVMATIREKKPTPVAASSSKNQAVQTPKVVLTDPNKVILVSQNSPMFTISLKSNPSTGYSWFLIDDYNSSVVKPVFHQYHAKASKLTGVPGYETFTFKVNEGEFNVPQKIHLIFQYLRPWVVMEHSKKLTFTIITNAEK